jgi:hypothetical protein
MAAGLLLEFEGINQGQYDAVNQKLGLDPKSGKGDWPPGMRSHAAGMSDDGTLVVTEVWDTQEHQATFMETRLAKALQDADVPPPSRLVWVDLVSYHTP